MKQLSVLILFLVLASPASYLQAQDVKFEYQFKPGDLTKTKLTQRTKISGEPLRGRSFDVVLEQFSSEQVEAVNEQGIVNSIVNQDSVYATFNGQALEHPGAEKLNGIQYRVKRTKGGKCLEKTPVKELPADLKLNLDIEQQECKNDQGFPEKTMKVGESWTEEKAFSLDLGGVKFDYTVSINNKFLGFDRRDGYDCAVFRQNATMNGALNFEEGTGTVTGTGKGTRFFAVSIGKDIMSFMDITASREIESARGKETVRIVLNYRNEIRK